MSDQESRRSALRVLGMCIGQAAEEDGLATSQSTDGIIADFIVANDGDLAKIGAAGWGFCVPREFRSALDIRQSVSGLSEDADMCWSQGSRFRFDQGDTLYDSWRAYLPWDLKNFNVCLQVRSGTPAQPTSRSDRTSRNPGRVLFDVFTPDPTRSRLEPRETAVEMTQDDFVRLLIEGPRSGWISG